MKWLTGILLAFAAVAGTAAAVEYYDPAVDTNHDWKIDLKDLATLAGHWSQTCSSPGWCDGADNDHSGAVDLTDLMRLAGSWLTYAPVVINEIMYHPGAGNTGDEYLELYNRSNEPVNLTGWTLSEAFSFAFAAGTVLPVNGYLVVCRDETLARAYYGITNTAGSYTTQNLGNAGERIVLQDSHGIIVDDVTYSDGSHPVGTDPWQTLPDGAGPSLELIDPGLDNNLAANWGVGQSYTPGGANNPSIVNAGGDIVINEIMYNPQRQELREKFDAANMGFYYEQGDDLYGEYVELYNRGATTVNFNGWRFTDGINYTFGPNDPNLAPGQYLLVAAYPNAVKARFGITNVAGPFQGGLNNGGEIIILCNAVGQWIDVVRYDDGWPWPLAPDECGYSVECINFLADNNGPANWRSSRTILQAMPGLTPPLGGVVGRGTPGWQNSVFAAMIPPLITDVVHTPQYPTSSNPVTVTAKITGSRPVTTVALERFLNNNVTSTLLTMYDDGAHGDAAAGDGIYGVVAPAQPSQTLVHYRIRATDDQNQRTIFPYEDDPAWTLGYYHYNGELGSGGTFYHLFITQANIDTLLAGVPTNAEVEVDCSLVINHTAYPHIKAAFRGRWSRGQFPYHWKFKFNKNLLYNNINHLDTMFSVPDIQECVYDAFETVGLLTLEHEYIPMYLNKGSSNGFWANYMAFESPNSTWLKKHNYSDDSEIYKCRSVESSNPRRNSDLFFFGNPGNELPNNGLQTDYNYWGAYNKRVRDLEPPVHIRDLVYNLNMLSDDALLPWLDAHVDMDTMLKSWAMHVYLRCDDFAGHNTYLFLPDGWTGKWKLLSYDFDSFGRWTLLPPFYGSGLNYGENPDWQRNKFYDRVQTNPTLHRIYLLIVRSLIVNYPPEALLPPSRSDMISQVTEERDYLLSMLTAENLPDVSKAPTVNPAGGTFSGSVSVTLTTGINWQAYYTLDGTDPRLSPTRQIYTQPFTIAQSAVLKAAASKIGQPLNAGQWTDLKTFVFVIQ